MSDHGSCMLIADAEAQGLVNLLEGERRKVLVVVMVSDEAGLSVSYRATDTTTRNDVDLFAKGADYVGVQMRAAIARAVK